MSIPLQLPKFNNEKVVKLTSFYNAIKSNLWQMMTMGLKPFHYDPFLIPVILQRLLDSIKLIL